MSLFLMLLLFAQTQEKNPYASPEHVEEGKRMFRFYCVNCHGMDGASGRGARLASTFRRYGTSDREMFRTIYNGIPGTEMPGLWMDEETIWKILSYVRTLESTKLPVCGTDAASVERGRQLYGRQGCANCHALGKSGGRLGPDLTAIGAARGQSQLREALLDPAKTIPKRYRTGVAVTKAGVRIQGAILNEDEYTVHLMDAAEKIHSWERRELKSMEYPERSLMPAYTKLSNTEIEDLIGFLCAERGTK